MQRALKAARVVAVTGATGCAVLLPGIGDTGAARAADTVVETIHVGPGRTTADRIITRTSLDRDAGHRLVISGAMKRTFPPPSDAQPHMFDAFYCFAITPPVSLCNEGEPFFGLQILNAGGALQKFAESGSALEPPYAPDHRYTVTPITYNPGPFSFFARPFGNADVGGAIIEGSFTVQIVSSRQPKCAGRTATIVHDADAPIGTPIFGTNGDDVIVGSGQADVIFGRGGRDLICAEGGNDTIAGNALRDRIYGGEGNDRITGGDDGAGDVLDGERGNDRISGGPGDDLLIGRGGNDQLLGGSGEDRLFYHSGEDLLNGGPDGGTAEFQDLGVRIIVDLSSGTALGGVRLRAIDDVVGTRFNDVIGGNPRANTISGGGGRDKIYGRGGNDHVLGDSGDDDLFGGGGVDALDGGPGHDECNGGERLLRCEQVRRR